MQSQSFHRGLYHPQTWGERAQRSFDPEASVVVDWKNRGDHRYEAVAGCLQFHGRSPLRA